MNAQEILDNLKPTGEQDELRGSFLWAGRSVKLSVFPDKARQEDALGLAHRMLEEFEEFVRRSKDELVKCLAAYNDDWRDDDEPILTAEEFLSNFHLNAIFILGDKSIDFVYDESGMFGNHFMLAQIFDGENFGGVMMCG